MTDWSQFQTIILIWTFILAQGLYSLAFAADLYLFSLPRNFVDTAQQPNVPDEKLPYIVLFYPVLRELEETMRSTFISLGRIDYPKARYRIVAVPNSDDHETIASLRRLRREFDFLDIIETPPTRHPSWAGVWANWDANPKAYWWHQGPRARDRNLPPKKTRQLIYALHHTCQAMAGREDDFLVNYIDADSCPPLDHFRAAVAGMQRYDVLQATNIAGNLNATLAASWHSLDHMAWDGFKYPHLSADGRQPFWTLGKGLFFRASDLADLGGLHPWIAIEDPEVGMRFWVNGKRLGVIANPLIEEVPATFMGGITQRKRWVCGFFQSLASPLKQMGMTPIQRLKARLNFAPCLSLAINAIGWPTGVWALIVWAQGTSPLPTWTLLLAALNLVALCATLTGIYAATWKRTALVLDRRRDRIWYMLRVNPLLAMVWWLVWLIPLAIGFGMFLRSGGLVWDRTRKIDANHALVRVRFGAAPTRRGHHGAGAPAQPER